MAIAEQNEKPALTKRDFESDQEVRWCPGCGDYAILAQVQRVLPELGVPRENIVFVSGIGCSSRFPYYLNTYGFHTLHGRAPGIASGLKMSRPELSVWIATGDGDALSIGGNHLIHILRRNLDINILLFNNQIYGLTKGQYSPTSEVGKVTKSTPEGSVDYPFKPPVLALGAEATFVARSIDVEAKHLQSILRAAHAHRGTSFVEILQNCNIFNDGAFDDVTTRATKLEKQLILEDGQPMIFGKERDKAIRMSGMRPEVVAIADIGENEILVHDVQNPVQAFLLGHMTTAEFPTPIGVIYDIDRPVYEEGLQRQLAEAKASSDANLHDLLHSGDVWTVE
ncbi:MAG: 2-oxoacid:ferredoxin oxidoreductase subunit beta [Deltaproteobacteria bacterium]